MKFVVSYLSYKRAVKGLTQEEVANALGVTQTAISALERYKARLKQENIEKYCQAIDITLEEFEDAFKNKKMISLV